MSSLHDNPTATGPYDDDDGAQEPSSARLPVTIGALVGICVLAAALIALFATKTTPHLQPGKPVPGEEKTFDMLNAVPQHGFALGNAHAPVTLVEYAGLRCLGCAEFANDTLPELVSRYVDSGELRLVFRPLDANGADSLRAAQAAAALAQQNLLWQFVGLVYHNQPTENSEEFVDETYVAALIEAIPGSHLADALATRDTTKVSAEIARFAAESRSRHLTAEPSFLLSRTGHPGHSFKPSSIVDSNTFADTIESLLPHHH